MSETSGLSPVSTVSLTAPTSTYTYCTLTKVSTSATATAIFEGLNNVQFEDFAAQTPIAEETIETTEKTEPQLAANTRAECKDAHLDVLQIIKRTTREEHSVSELNVCSKHQAKNQGQNDVFNGPSLFRLADYETQAPINAVTSSVQPDLSSVQPDLSSVQPDLSSVQAIEATKDSLATSMQVAVTGRTLMFQQQHLYFTERSIPRERQGEEKVNTVVWKQPTPFMKRPAVDDGLTNDGHFVNHDSVAPGMQPRSRRKCQPSTITSEPGIFSDGTDIIQGDNVVYPVYNPKIVKLLSREDATETVVRSAIQYLIKDKDMTLSYTSVLSVIDILGRNDRDQPGGVIPPTFSAKLKSESNSTINLFSRQKNMKVKLSRLLSKLLRIITQPEISEELVREIVRQNVISAGALYLQLYRTIQDAGYSLQDQDHLRICLFLVGHHMTEDALPCLNSIDTARWTGKVYRAAILCHLFSKPRQLHQAEFKLKEYLEYVETPLLSNRNKLNFSFMSLQNDRNRKNVNRTMIREWFELQLDASRWEEVKALYERRRDRLLEAPNKIERFAAYISTIMVRNDGPCLRHPNNSRRASTGSYVSASSSLSTGTITSSNSATLPKVIKPKESSFLGAWKPSSVFSAFTLSSSNPAICSCSPLNPDYSINAIHTTDSRPIVNASLNLALQSKSPAKVRINSQLIALYNDMLEECVNHKQFEYGWRQVYERMGPHLENKRTSKIAMTLCKRAFLGHSGHSPDQPGSPNMSTTHTCFEDELNSFDHIDEQYDGGEGEGVGNGEENHDSWGDSLEAFRQKCSDGVCTRTKREDAEIWEARAWVIYNRVMANPSASIIQNNNSSSGSPLFSTPAQQPLVSTQGLDTASVDGTGNKHWVTPSIPSQYLATAMTGTTSLAIILQSILTIAINSPERSSRLLKAIKVYSAMRDDPLQRYQVELRDPFVMTCMIKVIYDTVMTIVKGQHQQHHCMEAGANIGQTQQQSAMAFGPLIDLAFEIYADMRSVYSIRPLAQLTSLTPPLLLKTPNNQSRTCGQGTGHSDKANKLTISNTMSLFFQLSNRPPPAPLSAVDLSAGGALTSLRFISPRLASSTIAGWPVVDTENGGETCQSTDTDVVGATPCILQELNPSLVPNPYARRLPSELYLALLHLCNQVPISGLRQSITVVKTIVADMMMAKSGQQPANLDRHLAAALQFYHDQWMCRPQELKGRRSASPEAYGRHDSTNDNEESFMPGVSYRGRDRRCCLEGVEESQGCKYHGWMYRPEEYVLEHMKASSSSSSLFRRESVYDLSDPISMNINLASTSEPELRARGRRSGSNVNTYNSFNGTSFQSDTGGQSEDSQEEEDEQQYKHQVEEDKEREDSYYSISKNDADLDELDQYLEARAAYTPSSSSSSSSASASASAVPNSKGRTNGFDETRSHWTEDRIDHDTCNDRLYWDLWSHQDPVLYRIKFSRRRARALWRHIANLM
ncbi:hypothetical protein BCR41DRAFT_402636 [Lobosporangium transversale]|uniref:Uncharacterized protein n=1 Tax=Lobosporangium transversale TaxID=64571 RepID=A0A1Y2G130_9FUNG|nr:hypothetical protein BCR41DRAFT_402636 [Lobosporangium transversale]ORY90608.1 hypothetical protein BCR41DRAFT_402636 [Lobosporangium transversale]|eukprot:XP_021875103.1 hypothetical protein BCR41DRAFT_402636 [Lobosporangium transversale]